LEIPEASRERVRSELYENHSSVPVYLDKETADNHYNGFSNSVLWPLFHYQTGELRFDEDKWQAYVEANTAFADVICEIARDGDLLWIHDYHLMLLPALLRERLSAANKRVKIGFFLHTPFPASEIYRWARVCFGTRESSPPRPAPGRFAPTFLTGQILQGLLQSDLVGFHTHDYAHHFRTSCETVLGLDARPDGVEVGNKLVSVGVFPIGIDPDIFSEGLKTEQAVARIKKLKETFNGVKIIIGVDRLDYIKGVPQKLEAFEAFLTQHPEWIGKVVLVQIAVPSRGDVEEYQNLETAVNEQVGRINGKFGTVSFTPIVFLHRSVNFDELCSLYAAADVCLVSSTRDGMNLVSYEYIACQKERHGVMILSEFAGAAQRLNGSLIVNPWNTDELANAIHEAVGMPEDVRRSNHQKLYGYVTKYTAAYWGLSFVNEL
ncbi:MAG: hypothetical protein BJ554DRAFT_6126, partial [Olpidium bornovanus]